MGDAGVDLRQSTFAADTQAVILRKKIFIVEDHAAFRKALVQLLKTMREVEVCGDVGDAEQALVCLPSAAADLVLVDLGLPGTMNGFDLAVEIGKRFPPLACVIVTGHRQQNLVDQARTLGLQGYVDKAESSQLISAIRAVLTGKTYFSSFD